MKAFSKLFLLFFFAVLSVANAQKVGHINLQDLVQMLPETRKADTEFQAYKRQLTIRDSLMVLQYQTGLAKRAGSTLPDSVQNIENDKLNDLQSSIQQFEANAEDSLEVRRQKLYTPISDRVVNAVKEVAKENGYVYVFDMSAGAVIYAAEEYNMMEPVKKKLGLK